jgi:hypothetical protein
MAKKKLTLREKMNSPEVVAKVAEITDFCIEKGLKAELCGVWVWVSFEEKPSDELRKELKEVGFRWSPRRKKWAHNCGVKTASSKTGNPFEKYGSVPLRKKAS